MKITNILTATVITAWSGMACAGLVTTFGQTANGFTTFPLTTYPEAADARSAFLGIGPASSFNFESANVNDTSLNISIGGVTAVLSGGIVREGPSGGTDEGRYSVSGVSGASTDEQGDQYWEATAPVLGSSSFLLQFSQAVDSFSFLGTDIGDFDGLLTLELTMASDPSIKVQVSPGYGGPYGDPLDSTNGADASVLFFGVRATVAADYFTSVRFISTGGSAADVFGFDMFTVSAAPGTPVPLPGSLALVGAALGGLALVRRRR